MTPDSRWSSTSGSEKTSSVSMQLPPRAPAAPAQGSCSPLHIPVSWERANSARVCDAQLFCGVSAACVWSATGDLLLVLLASEG